MIRAFFVCNMGTTNLGQFMFLSGLEAEDYPTREQYGNMAFCGTKRTDLVNYQKS